MWPFNRNRRLTLLDLAGAEAVRAALESWQGRGKVLYLVRRTSCDIEGHLCADGLALYWKPIEQAGSLVIGFDVGDADTLFVLQSGVGSVCRSIGFWEGDPDCLVSLNLSFDEFLTSFELWTETDIGQSERKGQK